jgi:ASC-1-like (ASCH) protein
MATHFMNLKPAPFNSIKAGKKDVEMRLYDDKRRLINKQDLIVFTNEESKETLTCKVLSITRFKSFAELYAAFNKVRLGYDEDEIAKPEDMMQYYPQLEMQANGVCAIEIKLL